MNTEFEKKELEELEIPQNIKVEKMRYQKNSLSYMLGFGGIGCSILGAFILLNSLTPDIYTIFKILLNIVILLFGFMCCENMKNYREKSAYMMLGIAGICFARIFFGPIVLYNNYSKLLDYTNDADGLVSAEKDEVSKWLGSSIMDNSGFLPGNGHLRATIALVALAASVAFFALSAIVCISKARMLKKHMIEHN